MIIGENDLKQSERVISDDQLYNQYLSGDSASADQLLLRHGDALTAYLCAFLHNAQDAEDLMIESFARIIAKKPSIREGGFKAYLYKTARNLGIRFAEKQRRTQTFLLDEQDKNIADPILTEKLLLENEKKEAIYRCLGRIAQEYKEALWLVYLEDLSYIQAADVMRVSRKKIDNLLSRGKLILRKELEKEGITGAYD